MLIARLNSRLQPILMRSSLRAYCKYTMTSAQPHLHQLQGGVQQHRAPTTSSLATTSSNRPTTNGSLAARLDPDGSSRTAAAAAVAAATSNGSLSFSQRDLTITSDDDADYYDDADEVKHEPHCCYDEIRFCRELCGLACEAFRKTRKTARSKNFAIYVRKKCSLENLRAWFPLLTWLPKYRLPELQGDIIAGLTVGLTLLPQAIAYADLAGLPPEYGLYSSFIGPFIYVLFGTAKDVTLGPSAIMSLMTAEFATSPIPRDATYAIVLGLFTGIVQIVMGILSLGFIMDFISFPVLKAFSTAAAITIAMSQVKTWLGLKNIPRDFLGQLYWCLRKIPETRLWDFLLGCICIVFIIFFKKLKEIKWKLKYNDMPCWQKAIVKIFWIIGTARNIVVIIVASSIAAALSLVNNIKPFTFTGYIPPGIPPFTVPKFSVTSNTTDAKTYTFSDISSKIGAGFALVPIIGLIEAMAVASVFARRCHYKIDPNQELVAYGISNILGAFVSGYPVTGTFSRTAVNYQSGVKTPAGGILTAILVLLALQFITPLFYYIPKAVLSVVIIMAVLDMITFHKVSVFWRTRKVDLIPWFVTFVMSFVLGLEYGVVIGAGLSMLLLIYPASRPKVKVKKKTAESILHQKHMKPSAKHGQVVIVELSNGLMYPAVEFIRRKVISVGSGAESPSGVVLDLQHVAVIDASAVQCIRQLMEEFYAVNIKLVLCHVQPAVERVLLKSELQHYLQAASVYEAVQVIFGIPRPPTAYQFTSQFGLQMQSPDLGASYIERSSV